METTERIVESYVRSVLGCATIPNIRCADQFEIDLLAIQPKTLDRYHIETSVSISRSFNKLTDTEFDPELLKKRVYVAKQRRTLGYFAERKFAAQPVLERLKDYGFEDGNYRRVIVTWDWTDGAAALAKAHALELWSIRDLMAKIVEKSRGTRHYFTDDTLRTLHLFDLMLREQA